MNIMDLPIGGIGVTASGLEYRVIKDRRERIPGMGVRTVRLTQDQFGRFQKFLQGIEVMAKVEPDQFHRPQGTEGDVR